MMRIRTPGHRRAHRPRGGTLLVDEHHEPSVRRLLGTLLADALEADFAIARIRLAGIDLDRTELARLRHCRVLIGRLDADTFADAADAASAPSRRRNLEVLLAFLRSGRLEVRAAGPNAWSPDFSLLRTAPRGVLARSRYVAVVGAHYFARPYPRGGPALTCFLSGRAAAARVGKRFEELWRRGHDVLPIIREVLESLLEAATRGPGT